MSCPLGERTVWDDDIPEACRACLETEKNYRDYEREPLIPEDGDIDPSDQFLTIEELRQSAFTSMGMKRMGQSAARHIQREEYDPDMPGFKYQVECVSYVVDCLKS